MHIIYLYIFVFNYVQLYSFILVCIIIVIPCLAYTQLGIRQYRIGYVALPYVQMLMELVTVSYGSIGYFQNLLISKVLLSTLVFRTSRAMMSCPGINLHPSPGQQVRHLVPAWAASSLDFYSLMAFIYEVFLVLSVSHDLDYIYS